MKKTLKFSFLKYLIYIFLFLIFTSLIMFLVLSMYNNLNISNELDISTILTMYIALVVVFTLIHSLDLKKRFIEISEINSKYKICYHYFQSEADSSLLEFGATKKNIYFDYAKKIRNGIFFITLYEISEKRNLRIPKVFDDMNLIIESINKNKELNN